MYGVVIHALFDLLLLFFSVAMGFCISVDMRVKDDWTWFVHTVTKRRVLNVKNR